MEDTIFKILTESRIYFCEEGKDPLTTSVRAMMSCFDVFIFEEGWLFYRLKEDCYDRGYLDEDEYLIGPCDGYENMICMAKLFESEIPVDYVDSPSWIEEEDFHHHRKRGTLPHLIEEMCKIDQADRDSSGDIKVDPDEDDDKSEEYVSPDSPPPSHSRSFDKSNSSPSPSSRSTSNSSSSSSSHHEEPEVKYDETGNFEHGFSSDEDSEESEGISQ